ncbi:hypothetical protein [Anaerophaga thermohalophila]|uniref:hypothetical protein n=1 Tax=Anaerophaga thermohalophila TaxID=177400 RepID=UPI000237D22C|nr:hypothetical protein [Anaerophaga thermohalophila]
MKQKRKIHKDKNGLDYIKESYFVGGKMKFRKVYVIDGIPAEDFFEKNATDINHYLNCEYWLINKESDREEPDLSDEKNRDLPF